VDKLKLKKKENRLKQKKHLLQPKKEELMKKKLRDFRLLVIRKHEKQSRLKLNLSLIKSKLIL
jgi:hypothetical protein